MFVAAEVAVEGFVCMARIGEVGRLALVWVRCGGAELFVWCVCVCVCA
jgi:hypothetical protein